MSLLAAAAAAAASMAGCSPSLVDRQWMEEARSAWRRQLVRIPELTPPPQVSVILFDERCRAVSRNALARSGTVRWQSAAHRGQVLLGDGSRVPPGVMSFAGEGKVGGTFVMALPSLWEKAGVNGGPLGLRRMTIAVKLHEASHVAQTGLMTRVGALVRREKLGQDFNDDSIQKRFGGEAEFAASVKEETRLLFASSAATGDAEARRLAGDALRLMEARRQRWFRGSHRALIEAEDLFLSMEGAGQYVGYSWLIDPAGGAVAPADAMAGFGSRAKWWSQAQGLALVLTVKRLNLPGWRDHLWRRPDLIGSELLRAALATGTSGSPLSK
jgi:hypothetical protein